MRHLTKLPSAKTAVAHFQYILLVGCALLVPSATWALDQQDPALVGVWLFDEGAGNVVGDLVNGNDASFSTGPQFTWEPGIIGSAIKVDGAMGSSIEAPDSESISSITDGLTVAAWFRIDGNSDTGIRKQNSFLLEAQSDVEPVPDGFSFRVWTDQGITPGFYSKTQLLQGQWYHIAGTYDGTNVEMYMNGVPDSTFGALDSTGADWTPTWGGQVGDADDPLQLKFGSETLNGAIDEVVILNRKLEADEIAQLLQGWDTLPIPEPTAFSLLLLGLLPFTRCRRRLVNLT